LNIRFDLNDSHRLVSGSTFWFREPRFHADRCLPYHALLYVEGGGWSLRVGEESLFFTAGEVVIMPANCPHFGVQLSKPNTHGFYLHIAPEKGDGVMDNTDNSGVLLPAVVPLRHKERIREIFARLVGLYSSALPYKDRMCSSILDLLLLELAREGQPPAKDLRAELEELFISQPDHFFTNEELAAALSISRKTLERRFRAENGKTVHRYQMDRKLESAKELLGSFRELPLGEIAAMLGFYDASHFSRSFKQAFCISPEEFRKKLK